MNAETAAPLIGMRRAVTVQAGSLRHTATDLVTGWHRHDLHEIEHAVSGLRGPNAQSRVAEILTPTAHYLLPPHHAAWIPAGVPHSPILQHVETIAVFFDPTTFDLPDRQPVIFPVGPLLREMLAYTTRWAIDRPADDAEARAFFAALAGVVRRQLAHGEPDLSLPVSTDPVIAEVMAYTTAHLAEVTAADVCRAVGISDRSLRRHFPAVVGRTWRQYLQQARLFRAMAMLSTPDSAFGPRRPALSVRDVARTVGFESPSAFARAFHAWTGEQPSAYRDRWLTDTDTDAHPDTDAPQEWPIGRAVWPEWQLPEARPLVP